MKPSPLTARLLADLCGHAPTPEFRFDSVRRWRWDYAWVTQKVAVEVQGGIWINGGHSRGSGLVKQHEKLNAAAEQGWRVLYCQPKELLSPKFLQQLRNTIEGKLP